MILFPLRSAHRAWVRRAWLVVLLSLLSLSALAGDVAALKREGDRYMDNLDFSRALALYEKAYAQSGDPVFLYNSGRALQGLNRYPEALEKLEQFRRDAPPELLHRVPGLDPLIASVRSNVATLTIRSSVVGARVLIASKMVGTTPVEKLRVNAGSTKIEVFKDGYRPSSMTVTLEGGKPREVTFELVPMAQTGLLTVRANVQGAAVAVGDKNLGTAPTQTELRAGEHRVRVTHPDHDPFETMIVVKAGASTAVEAELQPSASVFESWWFWTVAGAVVAGAAVTGIVVAATSERDPDRGDIPPGQVSAPIGASAPAVWIALPAVAF